LVREGETEKKTGETERRGDPEQAEKKRSGERPRTGGNTGGRGMKKTMRG
jgi:hypothetical protein